MPDAGRVPFDELYAHRAWIRTLALRLARDPGAADDLEQETWIAAAETPPAPGNVRGWLGTVLRGKAWKRRRGTERRGRHEAAAPSHGVERPAEEILAAAEVHRRLVNLVMELDEPYRTAVVLRFFEGLSTADVARRLGVPAETAKTRLRRAVEMLRVRLARDFGDEPRAWLVPLFGFDPRTVPPVPPAVPLSVSTPAAAVPGALAMTAAQKTVLGCVAVVLLLGTGFGVWRTVGASSRATTSAVDEARAPAVRPRHADGAPKPDGPRDVATAVQPAAALATVEIDRTRDVHGEVVGPDGRPVAGATVRIEYAPTGDPPAPSAGQPKPQTTGADGAFSFRLDAGDVVELSAEAAGFAAQRIASVQAGERLRVALKAPVRLVVTVRDADGAPAAEVAVTVDGVALGAFSTGAPVIPRQTRSTDTQGRAAFDGLPAAADVRLQAWPRRRGGCVMATTRLAFSGETPFEMTLAAGEPIRGRVVDARGGGGIAGATVFVSDDGPRTTTDADGRFEVAGARRQDTATTVCATAPGRLRASVPGAPDKECVVALRAASRITGRVVDAAGAPVADARVLSLRRAAGFVVDAPVGRSGADGRFVLDGLDPSLACAVSVVARGRGAGELNVPADPTATERDVGDVRIAPAGEIAGRVLKVDGSPAPRFAVTLTGGSTGRQRFTDDLGRYRFPDLPPGKYEIGAAAAGPPQVRRPVEVVDARPLVEDFVEAAYDVVIETVDERGAPLAGVEVQALLGQAWSEKIRTDAAGRAVVTTSGRSTVNVVGIDGRPVVATPGAVMARPGKPLARFVVREAAHAKGVVLGLDGAPLANAQCDVRRDDGPFVGRYWTDAEGRFDVVLPVGARATAELLGPRVENGKPADDTRMQGRVELTAGATAVVLRAEPVAKTGSLAVRVLAPDGAPVDGAEVSAATALWRLAVKTDADGRALLAGLPTRELSVGASARAAGFDARPERLVPDGRELVLRLRRAASISGKLLEPDRSPIVRAAVWAEPASGGRRYMSTVTDDTGAFRIEVPVDEAGPFALNAQPFSPSGARDAWIENVAAGASGIEFVVR